MVADGLADVGVVPVTVGEIVGDGEVGAADGDVTDGEGLLGAVVLDDGVGVLDVGVLDDGVGALDDGGDDGALPRAGPIRPGEAT